MSPLILFHKFQIEWNGNLLVYKFLAMHVISTQFSMSFCHTLLYFCSFCKIESKSIYKKESKDLIHRLYQNSADYHEHCCIVYWVRCQVFSILITSTWIFLTNLKHGFLPAQFITMTGWMPKLPTSFNFILIMLISFYYKHTLLSYIIRSTP